MSQKLIFGFKTLVQINFLFDQIYNFYLKYIFITN